jgi:hypothetical protein
MSVSFTGSQNDGSLHTAPAAASGPFAFAQDDGPWQNRFFMAAPIRSFREFWPYYVAAHARPRTRVLHGIGSVLALMMLALALAVDVRFLILAPVIGYGFAWYAHFFVEHNRPATFGHPFYSLGADYLMLFLMMAGKMDEEVRRHAPAD